MTINVKGAKNHKSSIKYPRLKGRIFITPYLFTYTMPAHEYSRRAKEKTIN